MGALQRASNVVPKVRNFGAKVAINTIASVAGALILRFSGLLTDGSGFSISQFAVIVIVLFAILTVVTSVSTFEREDVKYLTTLSLIIAVVALYQWTYSFQDIASEPWSIFAVQLPALGLILASVCVLRMWTE